VRVRRLLFVFAPILFGGATTVYAALGDAPRCPLPAAPQAMKPIASTHPLILQLRQVIAADDPKERDYLIRTIAFEASGESEEGKAAVAHVILNRKRTGRWGDSVKAVVTHPWQFEPWMTKRREIEQLSRTDPRYQSAERIVNAVLNGATPDPTAGATHFLNPEIVRGRLGGSLPAWARGEGQPIGKHTFYSPEGKAAPGTDGEDAATQAAALSLGIVAISTASADSACSGERLTARSPGLPADDLVLLDVGFSLKD
jgi:Cell Wall Hydrolase